MSLKSRLDKLEDGAHPPKPHGCVMLYDANKQEEAPAPSRVAPGAKVVILLPKNGREVRTMARAQTDPSPIDKEKL